MARVLARSGAWLILQGAAIEQIAGQLVISVHTVRQHLKSIFGKAQVRSRRDLVAKVFFTHYEPRLRDNERRTLGSKPVRGGPMAGQPAGPLAKAIHVLATREVQG